MQTHPTLPNTGTSHRFLPAEEELGLIKAEEARLRARLLRLQSQQRIRRLMKDLKQPKRKTSGIRFLHAFLIVLGLHVAVVGGFCGFSALRKMNASDRLALKEKSPAYAGVPDPEAKPLNSDATPPSARDHSGDPGSASKSTPPKMASHPQSPAKNALSKNPARSSKDSPVALKPTPKIRALFSRKFPAESRNNAVSGTSTDPIPLNPVATPRPSPAPPQNYTVGPGDTLSRVASMMGIPSSKIREANGLDSGNDLHVGQKLKIPAPDNSHQPLQLVENDPLDSTDGGHPRKTDAPELFIPKMEHIAPDGLYTVQRGDNPYLVARKLGVGFTDLMLANHISDPASVTVGMKLQVPKTQLASN